MIIEAELFKVIICREEQSYRSHI